MTSLQSIRIQRFKRINDASFDLSDINVLVGGNNSGKSSLIQAFHFGISLLQTIALDPDKWRPTNNSLSLSLSPNQLIYCPSEDAYAIGPGGQLHENADRAILIEYRLSNGTETKVSVRKGRNKNLVVGVTNASVARELASLENPYSIFSPGLAGIAKRENFVSDGVLLRTLARGDANLVLRNILYRLWGTQKWQNLTDDLHQVFPGVELQVSFAPETDEFIDVKLRMGITTQGFVPLEIAGTGMLQAIQILSYIHRFNPSVIVLDEPDSHLHPNNQRLLCGVLRKVSEDEETQVVLTTHSRHIVDSIGGRASFLWVRNGVIDQAGPDDEISILMDLGALDIKERAARPDMKAIVLTEDEIIRPLQILLESSGFNMNQTEVLSYFGVTTIKHLRPLVNIIRGINPNVKILLHRDGDFLSEDEKEAWKVSIRALNVEPFVTEGRDVESHFFNKDYLISANPNLSLEALEPIIATTLEQTHEACVASYVNGRVDILRNSGRGATVNAGQIAVEAATAISQNRTRYIGKPEIKRLRHLVQSELRSNLNTSLVSPLLRNDNLSSFAQRAFRTN